MNWTMGILAGVYLVIGILIAECFIGSLEAARHANNGETAELPKLTRWAFRIIVVALSVWQAFMPYLARTILLVVFVVLGFIWSMAKPLRGNTGRKAAATAMLLLCFPASISIIWDVVLELIDHGWNTPWQKIVWVFGPIAALIVLLLAGEVEEGEPDELKKQGTTWIVIAIIMIAITALVGYFMQKGGMFA